MPLGKLILYKLKIFLAGFTRGTSRKRYVRIITVLVVGAAFLGFCAAAYGLFAALGLAGQDAFFMAGIIVTLAFHGLLLLAFVFDVAATASIFFLSSDLSLLMAAPIPALRVFVLKYFEALGSGSLITSFIAFPILFGFGLAFGAPWVFYLAVFAIVFLFLTVPVSIGTITGLLISRVVPISRVKEVLGMAGGVMALGFWIAIQLLRPALRENIQSGDVIARMKDVTEHGAGAVMKLLPSSMAANSLIDIAARTPRHALASILFLTLVAGVLFTVSVVFAQRMYLSGYVRVAPAAGTRRPHRSPTIGRLVGWLPPLERSMVSTTASLFFRDPQQIMPVATITIMMALFPFLIGRSRGIGIINPAVVLQSFAALSFVGALNLAVNATMIDGRSFWLILSAPRSTMRKLFSKLLVSALFFAPLATAGAFAFRAAGFITWAMVPRAVWFAVCMTFLGGSIGVMLAMLYGDWQWEIPKRMLKTSGRLFMLGVMGAFFGAIAVVAAAGSPTTGRRLLAETPGPVLVLIGLLVAALTYVFMKIAASRMDRMEWGG
jgi:hypothetical protein